MARRRRRAADRADGADPCRKAACCWPDCRYATGTRLPEVHRLVRQRLANPRLLLGSVLVVEPATVARLAPALVPGVSLGAGGTYHHLCPAFVTTHDHPALDAIPDHSPISLRMMLDPAFERMTLLRDDDALPDGA